MVVFARFWLAALRAFAAKHRLDLEAVPLALGMAVCSLGVPMSETEKRIKTLVPVIVDATTGATRSRIVLPDYLPLHLYRDLSQMVLDWDDDGDDAGSLVLAILDKFVEHNHCEKSVKA